MIYRVKVLETHHIEATYEVEALTSAEARELAEKGETVDEDRSKVGEVVGRWAMWEPAEVPRPKAWVVVMVDTASSDPIKNAITQLRTAALIREAAKLGIESDIRFHGMLADHYVECTPDQAYDLVTKLARIGCVDIHVFTKDETIAGLIETTHRGLFRVCRNEYKRASAEESE